MSLFWAAPLAYSRPRAGAQGGGFCRAVWCCLGQTLMQLADCRLNSCST